MRWILWLLLAAPLWAGEVYESVESLWADHQDRLQAASVVLIGERHTQAAHHDAQLALIKRLAKDRPLTIALEALGSDQQKAVSAYLRGELDEAAFLDRSNWFDRWGYDFRLMAPLFRYAREEGIAILALNFPENHHRYLLEHNESGNLPDILFEPMHGDRRALLDKLHDRHPGSGSLSRFLFGQQLWEAQMATRAAYYQKAHPDRHLVILTGNGHLGTRWGIGANMARLGVKEWVSIVQDSNRSLEGHLHLEPSADMGRCLSPTLGLFFDTNLTVAAVMEDSLAQKGAIQKGDRLLSINDRTPASTAEVRRALYGAGSSGQLVLGVRRDGKRVRVDLSRWVQRCEDTH
jgi:uncharacterized iron-regulated protein